jgi:hypothetical protein
MMKSFLLNVRRHPDLSGQHLTTRSFKKPPMPATGAHPPAALENYSREVVKQIPIQQSDLPAIKSSCGKN